MPAVLGKKQLEDSWLRGEFMKFLSMYNKSHHTQESLDERFHIYKDNVRKVHEHNSLE